MTPCLRSRWSPQPHQAAVLAHDTGIDICVGGVGAGKSQVAAQKVLAWTGRHPRKRDGRPARGLILGKDFKNAGGTQFLAIRERVAELGLPERAVIVEERGPAADHAPYLRFWNGVELHAYTGTDTDATRSFEADFLWADEAECMDLLSFTTALARLRGAEAMRAIVTSNPAGGGWIYPMLTGDVPEWDEIRRVNDVRVFRWAQRQNKHLDAKVSATLRATMRAARPGLERQELDGRFLGTAEAPGSGAVEFVRAFVGKVELARAPRASVVACDLAKIEDFCWLTAVSDEGLVLAMDRFNLLEWDLEGDGGTVTPSEEDYWEHVARRVLAFVVQWGGGGEVTVVLDSARGGDQFAALLRREAEAHGVVIRVEEVDTSSSAMKSRIVEGFGRSASMGKLVIPSAWTAPGQPTVTVRHVERLRGEWIKLQRIDKGKWPSYTHPPGGHDDGVVSVSLAAKVLSEQPATPDAGAFFAAALKPGGAAQRAAPPVATFGRGRSQGGGYIFR